MPEPIRTPILVEVCCGSLDDAITAMQAGANRIELNSGLPLGGLTPSSGLVREVLAAARIPVVAMVRPRPGGFCYSGNEWKTLLADARWMLENGVHGLAFGVLDESSHIDVRRTTEFVTQFRNVELVFHRAFDLTLDWTTALRQLADCGVHRVMTSGQAATAIEGADTIRKMIGLAEGQIEILPASGISVHNAQSLLQATGATQLHGTFSRPVHDPGYPPQNGIRFASNDDLRQPDQEQIRKLVRLLSQ